MSRSFAKLPGESPEAGLGVCPGQVRRHEPGGLARDHEDSRLPDTTHPVWIRPQADSRGKNCGVTGFSDRIGHNVNARQALRDVNVVPMTGDFDVVKSTTVWVFRRDDAAM